jgi:hypothetical protein
MPRANSTATLTALAPVSNDAERTINFEQPYIAEITVKGTAPFLFHRWSVEGVDAKSKAAKGSKAKKEDDLESYVYRDEDGMLAIPGEYFRMSCIGAAKFKQDPRSPRKSAQDLVKAGITLGGIYCTLGVRDWDYVDRRRVRVQQNAITRARPAINIGWRVVVLLQVLLPEYISPELLNEIVQIAGRLIGVGDNRPSYGRFQVVGFKILEG